MEGPIWCYKTKCSPCCEAIKAGKGALFVLLNNIVH